MIPAIAILNRHILPGFYILRHKYIAIDYGVNYNAVYHKS